MTKKSVIKYIVQFAVIAGFIYVAVQFVTITDNTVQTHTAEKTTITDSIFCNGIISREETVVTYSGNGLIGYSALDGQRVALGEDVASVYSSYEQMAQSASAQLITDEIEVLKKSNITSAGTDANMILNSVYTNLNGFLNESAQLNYEDLNEKKLDLQLAANKSEKVTQQVEDFSQGIALLEQVYMALSSGTAQSITAPQAGFFVSAHNSSAKVYSAQQLAEMSPTDFEKAAAVPAPQNAAEVAGKIYHDYEWSVFISVTAQQSEQFSVGAKVDIVLFEVESEPIPAFVQSVEVDEEAGVAKVELKCNYINEYVVKAEHTIVEVQLKDYTGLRISKSAIHVIDGVRGVFVQTGTRIDFCVIDVIFESDNYVLASLNYVAGENELKMFDSVVLSGRELYDGRVV